MRVLRVAFLSSAALEFFSAIAIALLAIYVGFSLAGYITFGPASYMSYDKGLMLLLLAPECFLSLRQLAQAHHEKSAAEAAETTLIELHNRLAQQHAPRAIAPDEGPHTALILEHLEFSYAANNTQAAPLIHDFSLTVMPGELVALKGDSGVGKSTLLHLVAGFLSPTAGCINRPKPIAWLGQSSRLFYGTLRENLQRARLDSITDEAMAAALAEVGLDLGSADLSHGLDTVIRERHQGISSGQAQRIAMARCLLQDARLWLLDEPTSALDETGRIALWATLKRLVSKHQIVALVATHDPEVEHHATRTIALAITHPRQHL
jgi:ATP-binding cassette subfamily C protein CydD